MAPRLNQVLAVLKGEKPRLYAELTELYRAVQKPALFDGFVKTFKPKHEDDQIPSERKVVQLTVHDVLLQETRKTSKLLDMAARVDWTNCHAKADIVIDGQTILAGVPATMLLQLHKKLTDTQTLIKALPVLDAGDIWKYDANSGLHVTDPIEVIRTKKITDKIVLLEPTQAHPGQAQLITKDVTAGVMQTVKQSGAMGKPEKEELLTRVEKLLNAVQEARERANSIEEVPTPNVGEAIFGFLNFRAATRSQD